MADAVPRVVPALPAAVLFDMDGTLIDSENLWIEAERELVESYGGTWTEAEGKSLVGFALLDSAALIQAHGVDLTPEQIVDRIQTGVVHRVKEEAVWQPGALELLASCRAAGVPTALVTMSWRVLADEVIAALPEHVFDVVVCGDEVERGKPDPQAYLLAAELLGVEPGDSVAVEDSPTGVASAYSAGCLVIGVPSQLPLEARDRVVVVDSLAGYGVGDLRGLAG